MIKGNIDENGSDGERAKWSQKQRIVNVQREGYVRPRCAICLFDMTTSLETN